jgi:DNA-3-methyladenine glycosylase II
MGAEPTRVRTAVEFVVGSSERPVSGEVGLTPAGRRVIELSIDEARHMGHKHIGTEHLLLGLIREKDGIAARVLEALGVGLDMARQEVMRLLALQVRPEVTVVSEGARQQAEVEASRLSGCGIVAVVTQHPALTTQSLALAVGDLTVRDADLRGIVDRFGLPPLWHRPAGFGTLAHIVLEQQVSLASAQAAFDRLRAAVNPLTPAGFLELDDGRLLAIGFSRQKANYVRNLARQVSSAALDLDRLAGMSDADVQRELVSLTGIGPWSASIYLMEALLRPDVWPATDMALAAAVTHVKGLHGRPDAVEMERLAEPWRPWRSVAARLFWHDYLSRRGQTIPSVDD